MSESVVVTRGVVQIEHRFRSLADGEPIAEVYFKLWLVESCSETVCLSVKVLLPVTESKCRAIETKLG